MTKRQRASRNPYQRLATQTLELSLAVPQVVTNRVARLAQAGSNPSPANQREFMRMWNEKVVAFHQSWWAMGMRTFQMQAQMARAMFSGTQAGNLPKAVAGILAAGLAPIHGKALANAKRLQKSSKV